MLKKIFSFLLLSLVITSSNAKSPAITNQSGKCFLQNKSFMSQKSKLNRDFKILSQSFRKSGWISKGDYKILDSIKIKLDSLNTLTYGGVSKTCESIESFSLTIDKIRKMIRVTYYNLHQTEHSELQNYDEKRMLFIKLQEDTKDENL